VPENVIDPWALLQALPDAVIAADPTGVIRYANVKAATLFGFAEDELLGRNIECLVPERYRPRHARLRESFSHSGALTRERRELAGLASDGSEILLEIALAPVQVDGLVVAVLKRPEATPRNHEMIRRLSDELAAVTGHEFFTRLVTLLAEVLEADVAFVAERVDGRPMLLRTIAASVDGALVDGFRYDVSGTACEQILETGMCTIAERARELCPTDRLLLEMNIEACSGIQLTDASGAALGLVVVLSRRHFDATMFVESTLRVCAIRAAAELQRLRSEKELRLSEERVRQAHKLEAVGTLAGGIAHDFNNLLTVILGNAQLIEEGLGPDHPRAHNLHDILTAGRSAASLTRRLLAFSRKQRVSPQLVDLNALVRALEGLLQRLVRENVMLVTTLGHGVPAVMIDPGQVEQVLINLVINARDAMPQGGQLTIGTSVASASSRSVAGASLFVADTGVGMDDATRARLFEPFFTTKPVGQGTGLGLSTVYGIVSQAGGRIAVDTAPGAGARFDIWLPAVDAANPRPPELDEARPARGGTETILLAEDSGEVRRFAADVLARSGYRVVEAVDGVDALTRRLALETPPQLLLTDVVMPRMTGIELARRLRADEPGLRVLFCSGYAGVGGSVDGLGVSGAFLQKPFSAAELLRAVRGALDAPLARAR
jgi:PAS domain S-box-containing protein